MYNETVTVLSIGEDDQRLDVNQTLVTQLARLALHDVNALEAEIAARRRRRRLVIRSVRYRMFLVIQTPQQAPMHRLNVREQAATTTIFRC